MVQATGIGSGLDIEGLVTQLVNAERAPVENRLLQRETRLTSELSAFGRLQSALAAGVPVVAIANPANAGLPLLDEARAVQGDLTDRAPFGM